MSDKKSPSKKDSIAYQSAALDDIRRQIDELDNRIHDTLMERAELVLKIGEEKRKKNIQIVQPAREARMIRRLLARHQGALPAMAVVRIWRELVGAVSLLQTGLKVAVALPQGANEYWDLARDYFGSCLPMQRMPTAIAAIAALREGKSTFAVLPWPGEEEDQPWWAFLGPNTPDAMTIIISLPHGHDPDNPSPDTRALVVSKSGFDSSGEDHSFLLIQSDQRNSRGRLVDLAKKAGLTALSLSTKRGTSPAMPDIHLMLVDDYVGKDDQRLKDFWSSMDDSGASIVCVGGYPVPPSYSKQVTAETQDKAEENAA